MPELEILEIAVLLDTDPDLAPWVWYASEYHQYHSIINPLMQVCLDAIIPNTDRFMAVVDHVFGPSSVLSAPRHHAVTILRAIVDNLNSFLVMTRSATLAHGSMSAIRERQESEVVTAPFDFGNINSGRGVTAEAVPQPHQHESPFVDHFLGTLYSEMDESGSWLQFPPRTAEGEGMEHQGLDRHDNP
jgi:hypothetical protein